MIGFVIVSHSARLAEGVCELAGQMGQGRVRLAPAGGTADPANPTGTDAFRVLEAIESVYSEDGVVVLMDLGSAVLSAETALELLDAERRPAVRLCPGPLIELAVATVSLAAAGAGIDEVVRGGAAPAAPPSPAEESRTVTMANRLGLHARPAAHLVRLARGFDAAVTLENLTTNSVPAPTGSISGLLGLGARYGHSVRVRAAGAQAARAATEIAAWIATGCGESGEAGTPAQAAPAVAVAPGQLSGIAASAGIAVGPLVRLRARAIAVADATVEDTGAEQQRLLAGLQAAQEETRGLARWAHAHAGRGEAAIFEAQSLFLEDPALIEDARRLIGERHSNAEAAWQAAADTFAARLAAVPDPYLQARAGDVADVAARVIERLTGTARQLPPLSQPAILAAADLAPSAVKSLDPAMVLGLCLEGGAAGAHNVILARAMGIPAVVGLGPALAAIAEGTPVALDGERGTVWIAPAPEQVRAIEERRAAWLAARRAAETGRRTPARTRDGRPIRVLANIGGVPGAVEAVEKGAEGVGVLRTEFLFLGRATAPSEEEQTAAYCAIAEALGGRPLTIRTLDIGGDKDLPYIETVKEANPFLGWRGIRLALGRPDLLRTQLRAILRTAADYPVEVLFPMVSSLQELRAARAALRECAAGLGTGEGMKAGVMIEVPAAAAIADRLAREADFFSIGTNDLIQYVMAADRTNPRVAALNDPFQPAVLRVLQHTIRAGRGAGIGVTLCGELAADVRATPLLLGLGLEEFSVSAPLIPALKQAIARTGLAEAERLAARALEMDSGEQVRALL